MTLPPWLQAPEFPDPHKTARATALRRIGLVFLGFGVPTLGLTFVAADPVATLVMAIASNAIWVAVFLSSPA